MTQPKRIITVAQLEAILAGVPARYRTMVLVAIETGLRWGELVALWPCAMDFTNRVVTVRRTILEVANKNSPTGERCFVKNYRKTMCRVEDRFAGVRVSEAGSEVRQLHGGIVSVAQRRVVP